MLITVFELYSDRKATGEVGGAHESGRLRISGNFMQLHCHKAIMLSVAKAKTPYAEQTVFIPSSYPTVQLVWSWFWKILWAFQFSSLYLVL